LVKQALLKSGIPVLWRLHFQLMLQFVLQPYKSLLSGHAEMKASKTVLLIRSVARKLGFLLITVKAINVGGLGLWD
jgi:hypothetical protein